HMVYSPLLIVIYGFIIFILAAASFFDIRNREVPDFISYVFLTGAILLVIALSIYTGSIQLIEFIPLSAALLFGFAYLMYRLGQWGGGDVKLMLGLSFLFTNISVQSGLSFIDLFINILLFGGAYGLLAMIVLGAVNYKSMGKHLKFYDYILFAVGAAAVALIYFLFPYPFNMLLALMVFLLAVIRYIYIVSAELMYREVDVSRLTEGDWLAEDIINRGRIVVRRSNVGLTEEEIEKLRKENLKKVRIKTGLPFVPGILIGAVITLFFANPLLSMLIL
ncbi:MAG: A24 family peptidase, partial [Candidatus Parvarchaeota archaeon]|nr:A24 family peptidase [Candidatus Parvarchaeota archaeon]